MFSELLMTRNLMTSGTKYAHEHFSSKTLHNSYGSEPLIERVTQIVKMVDLTKLFII
jgi:hypothetical protein